MTRRVSICRGEPLHADAAGVGRGCWRIRRRHDHQRPGRRRPPTRKWTRGDAATIVPGQKLTLVLKCHRPLVQRRHNASACLRCRGWSFSRPTVAANASERRGDQDWVSTALEPGRLSPAGGFTIRRRLPHGCRSTPARRVTRGYDQESRSGIHRHPARRPWRCGSGWPRRVQRQPDFRPSLETCGGRRVRTGRSTYSRPAMSWR